ncbi:V-type ATP synthase subunit D [Stappia sp. F7233]|uniref:V-type ATP synthase subunit D n=1 Tax=Stappia albiluteola TaxID=2758565 RepID=A0A839ADF4_9HYPH|nr:V-type ATP synthase subunit D [Stappia albiluteola]MBA5777561.1 V-type ATP synthase subunit D [Stappia albiluteola]
MAKPALNKSTLQRETRQLAEYRRFLPSLELKRLQIMAERARAKADLARMEKEFHDRFHEIADRIPMLANDLVPLDGLVTLKAVDVGEQNLSGTILPKLGKVDVEVEPYPLLGRPHWVDPVVEALRDLIRESLELDVMRERLKRLAEAEIVISRRVNLFEKVLIPQAQETIRRVKMALADAERDAVIRAKIAKRKTAARAAEGGVAEI